MKPIPLLALLVGALLLVEPLLVEPRSALAAPDSEGDPVAAEPMSPPDEAEPPRLAARPEGSALEGGVQLLEPSFQWNEAWPRFRAVEYVATAVLIAANTFGGTLVPPPTEVRWRGGILFDEVIREQALRVDDGVRRRMTKAGDYLYPAMSFLPIVLDSIILAWFVRGSFDVAWQTSMIAVQSMLTSAILNLVVKRTTARARPNVLPCDPEMNGGMDCPRGGAIRSFYSGHAAAAATGAGLLCVQHEYLDLFGGGLADHLTCAAGVGVALFVGVTRVVNDAHWASDTLAGWALGLGAGVLLPVALHYGSHAPERGVWVAPVVQEGGFGLSVGGPLR